MCTLIVRHSKPCCITRRVWDRGLGILAQITPVGHSVVGKCATISSMNLKLGQSNLIRSKLYSRGRRGCATAMIQCYLIQNATTAAPRRQQSGGCCRRGCTQQLGPRKISMQAGALLSSVAMVMAVIPVANALDSAPAPLLGGYAPSAMSPGFEVYVGFVAGVVPFIIASYEFGKRILIQQRCPECRGSGLVQRGRYLRKCARCGGMLPWLGWKAFFTATTAPGNGGPLLVGVCHGKRPHLSAMHPAQLTRTCTTKSRIDHPCCENNACSNPRVRPASSTQCPPSASRRRCQAALWGMKMRRGKKGMAVWRGNEAHYACYVWKAELLAFGAIRRFG
jgi:hypothetical protein